MRYVIVEKWLTSSGERKELRRSFAQGTDAASMMDAIEQFDAELIGLNRGSVTVLDRDTKTIE